MPRIVKTVPKPSTKAIACGSTRQRDVGRVTRGPAKGVTVAVAVAAALTMPIWPRYAGTTGRTHGEMNETIPAMSAAAIVRSTIVPAA